VLAPDNPIMVRTRVRVRVKVGVRSISSLGTRESHAINTIIQGVNGITQGTKIFNELFRPTISGRVLLKVETIGSISR